MHILLNYRPTNTLLQFMGMQLTSGLDIVPKSIKISSLPPLRLGRSMSLPLTIGGLGDPLVNQPKKG